MKEVFKEIWQGLDKKVFLITLLSIAFIACLASALIFGLCRVKNQVESIMDDPSFKQFKQTLPND